MGFSLLTLKIALEVGNILRRLGYEKDKHQSQGRSGKKRRWRSSGTSRRRTTPEAGQTPASDSDAGEASQVSTPFHQKDLNQREPVAAAATVGKTPERSERRRDPSAVPWLMSACSRHTHRRRTSRLCAAALNGGSTLAQPTSPSRPGHQPRCEVREFTTHARLRLTASSAAARSCTVGNRAIHLR